MDIPRKMRIPEWEFRVVFGRTKIEYDQDKEYSNREKHTYSLESTVSLLKRIVFPFGETVPHVTSDGFLEEGEVRHMHMSVDDCGKVVLMVTTMRPDESIRVISFRRASSSEREQFFQITGYREEA
ncbi:MAG: hypothetical protein USCGTAYLOR_03019 [Chromatiales bacterium USCg_Taylor]|nr:MAG: hypothetical protein USCGTAYLOR_03019 [Chromatiales bacterium USCg_Taylor]